MKLGKYHIVLFLVGGTIISGCLWTCLWDVLSMFLDFCVYLWRNGEKKTRQVAPRCAKVQNAHNISSFIADLAASSLQPPVDVSDMAPAQPVLVPGEVLAMLREAWEAKGRRSDVCWFWPQNMKVITFTSNNGFICIYTIVIYTCNYIYIYYIYISYIHIYTTPGQQFFLLTSCCNPLSLRLLTGFIWITWRIADQLVCF